MSQINNLKWVLSVRLPNKLFKVVCCNQDLLLTLKYRLEVWVDSPIITKQVTPKNYSFTPTNTMINNTPITWSSSANITLRMLYMCNKLKIMRGIYQVREKKSTVCLWVNTLLLIWGCISKERIKYCWWLKIWRNVVHCWGVRWLKLLVMSKPWTKYLAIVFVWNLSVKNRVKKYGWAQKMKIIN